MNEYQRKREGMKVIRSTVLEQLFQEITISTVLGQLFQEIIYRVCIMILKRDPDLSSKCLLFYFVCCLTSVRSTRWLGDLMFVYLRASIVYCEMCLVVRASV
uniref:Uncharacterized protein n=1 Tax=Cacopsylla melanoneura TaxID=428564 RepID=A0A8D8PWB9_9HEMI